MLRDHGDGDHDGRVLSTLDVIENYLTDREDQDFSTLRGRDIDEFGERVREFSAAHEPAIDRALHPVYLGGWPSANFALLGGDLILTSLLYSGQVLVRDPVADWFSTEQYRIEHMLAARAGYRMRGEGSEARTARTRAFLNTMVPALLQMRPLIEAGIVVPVPSEPLFFAHRRNIDQLRRDIQERIPLGPLEYAARFDSAEIASEPNVRGYFPMAPGPDPGPQIQRAIGHGIRYFAREYTLAATHGVTYTAPFDHERFLCQEGISPLVTPSARVVEAVMNSGLPVFHGLTPEIVRTVHDDDAFAAFRAKLHEVYQHTPVENPELARAYVLDQENALLRPLISDGENAARSGFLSRLGGSITSNKFAIATALAADATLGTLGAATGATIAGTVLDEFFRRPKAPAGPQRIWSSLVKHQRTAADEVRSVSFAASMHSGKHWGIPAEPSMAVTVTSGQIVWDADPTTLRTSPVGDGFSAESGPYRLCGCGSGRKYRFCCDGVK